MEALTFQSWQNDGMALVCLWLASPWLACGLLYLLVRPMLYIAQPT